MKPPSIHRRSCSPQTSARAAIRRRSSSANGSDCSWSTRSNRTWRLRRPDSFAVCRCGIERRTSGPRKCQGLRADLALPCRWSKETQSARADHRDSTGLATCQLRHTGAAPLSKLIAGATGQRS